MMTQVKTTQNRTNWLERNIFWRVTPTHLIVILLMAISLGLHLYNISAIGDANLYYSAAVKSMLGSWKNFFYAAAEPGGAVTVDKPPLGLWIETAFAYVLGVNGVAVSLPNILSGVFSVPLIFHLTRKYFGSLSGVTAALVYVFTPIVLAADRNNTMDGMLVFTLLLAAWAFSKATDNGKFRFLLIGSVLIGLGFNIKMLQAYLALPALMLLFLLGSKLHWGKRILWSGISVIVILAVSLSWAVIVDLMPTDERPYIGSSEDNTVMELIIGHNGLARLFGHQKGDQPSPAVNSTATENNHLPAALTGPYQPGIGQPPNNPNSEQPAQGRQQPPSYSGNLPQANGNNAFSQETGKPGIFRLFQAPLGKEMSWLLPLALFSMVLLAFSAPISLKRMSDTHKGVVLWGGWMLTCVVFFSMADFFHAYYMIMLAPPLAALIGAGFGWMADDDTHNRWKTGAAVFALLSTLLFEIHLATQFIAFALWMVIPMVLFAIAATILLFRTRQRGKKALMLLMLLSVMVIPAWWSIQTISEDNPHTGLPSAYSGKTNERGNLPDALDKDNRQEALIRFLDENTSDIQYLVAVQRANDGAPFVLATGRPVLYMGGFTGSDDVADVEDVKEMVENGNLRFVMMSNLNQQERELRQWLTTACIPVEAFSKKPSAQNSYMQERAPQNILFDCTTD